MEWGLLLLSASTAPRRCRVLSPSLVRGSPRVPRGGRGRWVVPAGSSRWFRVVSSVQSPSAVWCPGWPAFAGLWQVVHPGAAVSSRGCVSGKERESKMKNGNQLCAVCLLPAVVLAALFTAVASAQSTAQDSLPATASVLKEGVEVRLTFAEAVSSKRLLSMTR